MKRVAGLAAGLVAMVGGVDVAVAAKRADLALVKVSASPMSVAPGGSVRVVDTVRNRGAAKARATRLAYFLSKDARRGGADLRLSGHRKVEAVRVRSRAKGSRRLVVPASTPAGAYRLIACADSTLKVKERNERNNCRAARGTFRVTGSPAAAPVVTGGGATTGGTVPGPTPPPSSLSFPLAANPLRVTESADGARAATQQMYGSFENSMSVTAADGTQYTLTLPKDALLSSQTVTMTPVTAVAGSPLSGGLVGAVRLEPHGLELQKPAVLTIEAPDSGAIADQTAFAYHQGGHDFHLYPMGPEPTPTLRLMHFSTAGVALATASDRTTAAARVPRREIAQLEHLAAEAARERRGSNRGRASVLSDPGAVFIPFFDDVVRPKLVAAETNDALARDAIAQAISWARNAELIGLQDDPEYDKRRTEMYDRIERVLRNAVAKAYERCVQDHDLEQIVRLVSLARIAALNNFDLGDAWDKAQRCARFEVDFESRLTDTDGWTAPDGRTYDLDAVWHVRSLDLIIDITALGAKPITWAEFSYEGLNTYPCGEDPPLHSYSRGISTKPGNLQALLSLDLNPREAPPAGEPPPPPPDDYLQLLFTKPKETYRHWNEGCSNPYEPSDDEQSRWSDMFNHFHNGEFPFKVRIDREAQVGDLLEAKTWTDEKDTGTGTETEFSTLDLWHKPQP